MPSSPFPAGSLSEWCSLASVMGVSERDVSLVTA